VIIPFIFNHLPMVSGQFIQVVVALALDIHCDLFAQGRACPLMYVALILPELASFGLIPEFQDCREKREHGLREFTAPDDQWLTGHGCS